MVYVCAPELTVIRAQAYFLNLTKVSKTDGKRSFNSSNKMLLSLKNMNNNENMNIEVIEVVFQKKKSN